MTEELSDKAKRKATEALPAELPWEGKTADEILADIRGATDTIMKSPIVRQHPVPIGIHNGILKHGHIRRLQNCITQKQYEKERNRYEELESRLNPTRNFNCKDGCNED